MEIIKTIAEMKAVVSLLKKENKVIGLVPTMGFLHAGHISLAKKSVSENDITILSIYVNPIQFGVNEDLDKYPRDLENDCLLAKEAGVDYIFYPEDADMYPTGFYTYIDVTKITEGLCGNKRIGHFKGVATVVNKLFNICSADNAYFGQKDFQQAQVIRAMVADLNMSTSITVCPIVREPDGLAMSSRNAYLSVIERSKALELYHSICLAEELFSSGERNAAVIISKVKDLISKVEFAQIEYIEIVDFETLEKVKLISNKSVIALAVGIGKTRLIDNTILEA